MGAFCRGTEVRAVKAEIESDGLEITQQFWSGQAMVYDLRSQAGKVTLRVSGSTSERLLTEWRIEASTSTAPDAPVVAECGATRAEALQAVGRSWNGKRLANHLPTFDWESVARAMSAVDAL
ncbi:MAG: hypothetical protein ACRENE_08995 [Polyangiaceae bacterium]